MNPQEYAQWLQKELAQEGFTVPLGMLQKIGKKLAQPAKLWAEAITARDEAINKKAGEKSPRVKKKVTAHLFLGIALVEDNEPYEPSANQFAYDICDGDIIGDFQSLDSVRLSPKQIVPALLEIGNDGTYFGDDEDEE
jgi:hypothetical protein